MTIQSCIDETVNDMRKLPLSLTRSGCFDRKIEVANPVILAEEDAKASIIELFELEEYRDKIIWIADNSRHYRFVTDTMACFYPDDDEEKEHP